MSRAGRRGNAVEGKPYPATRAFCDGRPRAVRVFCALSGSRSDRDTRPARQKRRAQTRRLYAHD